MTFSDFSWNACVPFWAFVTFDGVTLCVFTGLFWWAWRDGLKQGADLGRQQAATSEPEPVDPVPVRGTFIDRDATAAHNRPFTGAHPYREHAGSRQGVHPISRG